MVEESHGRRPARRLVSLDEDDTIPYVSSYLVTALGAVQEGFGRHPDTSSSAWSAKDRGTDRNSLNEMAACRASLTLP